MKKLLLLLFLCAQPSSALTKYFYSTKIQEFCIQVDRAYAEEGHTVSEDGAQETEELTDKGQDFQDFVDIIELTPLVEFKIPFEIPDGLEEDLASLDQAEPLFIVTASGDNSDNSYNGRETFLPTDIERPSFLIPANFSEEDCKIENEGNQLINTNSDDKKNEKINNNEEEEDDFFVVDLTLLPFKEDDEKEIEIAITGKTFETLYRLNKKCS